MSTILTEQFIKLMDKNLSEVTEEVSRRMELKTIIPKMFRQFPSQRKYEEFYQIGAVPDIHAFNGRLQTLSRYPGYSTRIEPGAYASQLSTERMLLDDKQFSVLDDNARGLQKSAWRVADKKANRIFTNATSTAFDFMNSEEGVSLASSSHPTKYPSVSTASGFDNSGVSPMEKTSVAATRLIMRRFKQSNGERYEAGDDLRLVHPDALADTAFEITKTIKGLDSAEHNANPQYHRHGSESLMRWDETSTTSWCMVDWEQMLQDLIWIWRIKPESDRLVDWNTYSVMEKIYTRFGCGYKDWRWIYFHNV